MIAYKNLAANWQIQGETVVKVTKCHKVLDSLKIAKFEEFAVARDQAGMTRYISIMFAMLL
jgi:hypothetical protein